MIHLVFGIGLRIMIMKRLIAKVQPGLHVNHPRRSFSKASSLSFPGPRPARSGVFRAAQFLGDFANGPSRFEIDREGAGNNTDGPKALALFPLE